VLAMTREMIIEEGSFQNANREIEEKNTEDHQDDG
jgi:hypothetical protein